MSFYGRTPEDLPIKRKPIVPVSNDSFSLYNGPRTFSFTKNLGTFGDDVYGEKNVTVDLHDSLKISGYWVFGANMYAYPFDANYEFGFKLSEHGEDSPTEIFTRDVEPIISSDNLFVGKMIYVPVGRYVYCYVAFDGDYFTAEVTGWAYPIKF